MPKRDSQSHCLGVKNQKQRTHIFGSHTIRKNWHSSAHALAAHVGRSSFGDRNQNPYSRSSPGPRPSSKFLPRKAASKIKKRYRYGFSAQSIFGPCFENFCRHSDLFKTQNTWEETANRISEATTFLRFPNLDCWGKISWHTG